jgi:hypothetical protein
MADEINKNTPVVNPDANGLYRNQLIRAGGGTSQFAGLQTFGPVLDNTSFFPPIAAGAGNELSANRLHNYSSCSLQVAFTQAVNFAVPPQGATPVSIVFNEPALPVGSTVVKYSNVNPPIEAGQRFPETLRGAQLGLVNLSPNELQTVPPSTATVLLTYTLGISYRSAFAAPYRMAFDVFDGTNIVSQQDLMIYLNGGSPGVSTQYSNVTLRFVISNIPTNDVPTSLVLRCKDPSEAGNLEVNQMVVEATRLDHNWVGAPLAPTP